MARFFSSPDDVRVWVLSFKDETQVADKLRELIGSSRFNTDIARSVRDIFDGYVHGSDTLFRILSTIGITEDETMTEEIKKQQVEQPGLQKQAFMEKFPERAKMSLRYCPKLPRQGVSQGQVSTYNCRRWCADAIVFDDDPERVICGEALWRRHVMDKFSREWLDKKTGLLEGGYINDRFHVCRDELPTGEPRNSPRMSLKPGERSRQPKPYEYSTERRLEEQRAKNSTESIILTTKDNANLAKKSTVTKRQPVDTTVIKLAVRDTENPENDIVSAIFNDAIELYLGGKERSEATLQLSEEYGMSIESVARVQDLALRKYVSHSSNWYRTAEDVSDKFEEKMKEVSEETGLDDESKKPKQRVRPAKELVADDVPDIKNNEEI